ncbi:MAG: DUF2442 domain-containing protein [Candidatus Viridilinea halotolerans]|uniref:DUF2442 domain-containing protein n=1 Tax=Candidatus Viridilinea halotolerans TaxID=2491704 RepID=A0A426U5I5_9CHLR|nr:MAG: DUF2442 domain-containing protein [Candidatus Viridilinea halotolerans]
MTTFARVQSVEPSDGQCVRVVFTTGEEREIDLSPYIATGPIFALVRTDPAFFRTVFVDGGTVAWPNGADIDPDVLYHGGTPPWAEAKLYTEESRSR